jgi:hypothetical protein
MHHEDKVGRDGKLLDALSHAISDSLLDLLYVQTSFMDGFEKQSC